MTVILFQLLPSENIDSYLIIWSHIFQNMKSQTYLNHRKMLHSSILNPNIFKEMLFSLSCSIYIYIYIYIVFL